MKRKLLLLTFFVSMFLSIRAQSLLDVVYLKNGSIIRGVILEQVPNKSLKIQTQDKNVFVFTFDEIDRIQKEESERGKKPRREDKREERRDPVDPTVNNGLEQGIFVEPSVIVAPVIDGDNDHKRFILTHAQVTANCQINPYIGLGIGAGIRSYSFEDTYIPLYGQFRVNFKNKPVSPFLETSLGYGFATKGNDSGGAMFNLAFGFAKRMQKGQVRFGLIIDAFDRTYEEVHDDNTFDLYPNIGSASFGAKIGFTF